MDIWIVLENVDHGAATNLTSHLTRKGAYIEAWTSLLQSYVELQEDIDDGWIGEEQNGELKDLVDKTFAIWEDTDMGGDATKNLDWDNIKLSDLEQHFSDFQLAVHEPLDWAKEVTIHKTTAQA